MEQSYRISNIEAHQLKNTEFIGKQSPYAQFVIGKDKEQTKDSKNTGSEAVWPDVFHIKFPTEGPDAGLKTVTVRVYNDNTLRPDSLIGSVELTAPLKGGRYTLHDKKGKEAGFISFSIESEGGHGVTHGAHGTTRTGATDTARAGTGATTGSRTTGSRVTGRHVWRAEDAGPLPPDLHVQPAEGQYPHGSTVVGHDTGRTGTGVGTGSGVGAGSGIGGVGVGSGMTEGRGTAGTGYGTGTQPTMTEHARHAASEGVETAKDYLPGMQGHHTSAPGTGAGSTVVGHDTGRTGTGVGTGIGSAAGTGIGGHHHAPGAGTGIASGLGGHHHAPGTGAGTGLGNRGAGMGPGLNEGRGVAGTYGDNQTRTGTEPTMTERARHAASEGIETAKDYLPGMQGHHTPAPGTGTVGTGPTTGTGAIGQGYQTGRLA